jgi:GAF domain-containing protein
MAAALIVGILRRFYRGNNFQGGAEINTAGKGRTGRLKATIARLTRMQAREVLGKVDSALTSAQGQMAREAVVKTLNAAVPTYSWVGIYLTQGDDLLLDAWSGPNATEHTRISIGKGVCGFAAKAGRTEIVSDVGKDPRYIECFPSTRAEIVVPIFNQDKIVGEIDIDSDHLDAFSSLDREFLEAVARKLAPHCLQ